MKPSYHIVMIPEDSSQIHRMRLKPWQLRGFVLLSVALVLGLAVTAGGYLRYRGLYHKTIDLRTRYARVQQEQARLAQRLVQLEDTVERAENLVDKVGLLVQPQTVSPQQGVGPIERQPVTALGDPEKFADLSRLEAESFAQRFGDTVTQLLDRSTGLEERISSLYQGYQDRMVRLSSTPAIWPVSGWITSGFGMRRHPIMGRQSFHEGMDIAAPWGTPVFAAADGVVKYAGYKGGFGKMVVIDHGFGLVTYYGHNSRLHVKVGDKVTRGMKIASVGNTGHSTGSHLHYEVHLDGLPIDPTNFLPPRSASELAAVARTRAKRM